MSFTDFACVFVRAAGDRLLAAERLVCGFSHLFGASLAEVDLGYRISSKYLVVVAHFRPEAFDEAVQARLTFWTARAGGRATPLTGMPLAERKAFDVHLSLCELRLAGVKPAELEFALLGMPLATAPRAFSYEDVDEPMPDRPFAFGLVDAMLTMPVASRSRP